MNSIIFWIWLSLACTPGSTTFGKLIKECKTAEEIYELEGKRLGSILGFKCSDRAFLENKDLDRAKEIYEFCEKHKVGLLTYNDDAFPENLRRIENPPVLLYYRGVLPDFKKSFCVATVGTRSISDYGRKNAFKISYDLATAGATIVSGMARGIDGVCMAGALAGGGKVISVIGSGIDVCYPPQHLKLARETVKNGCVITEFAPGTQPGRYNFPRRNRLISGLSEATIVFEGEEKSGALITARCAKEQGRKVYALPGNVGSKNSELSSLLIKNGASICTMAEDVLNDFSKDFPTVINIFLLKDRLVADMMTVLRYYEVSAVCPNDDIFDPPHSRQVKKSVFEGRGGAIKVASISPSDPFGNAPVSRVTTADAEAMIEEKISSTNFDKKMLEIYKRIPAGEPCYIESLVDDNLEFKELMRYLLKLEISGFVSLLPGEMVARKFK